MANGESEDPQDIYTLPGIKTLCGGQYAGPNSRPGKFGWCLGDMTEVRQKGFRFYSEVALPKSSKQTVFFNRVLPPAVDKEDDSSGLEHDDISTSPLATPLDASGTSTPALQH